MMDFWNSVDRILMVTSAVTASYSAWAWFQHRQNEKRLAQHVVIRLVSATDPQKVHHELPYRPQRRMISRSEVLGFLGMIPSRQQRYDLVFLHSDEFFQRLEETRTGVITVLAIPVSATELAQFDLPPSPHMSPI